MDDFIPQKSIKWWFHLDIMIRDRSLSPLSCKLNIVRIILSSSVLKADSYYMNREANIYLLSLGVAYLRNTEFSTF